MRRSDGMMGWWVSCCWDIWNSLFFFGCVFDVGECQMRILCSLNHGDTSLTLWCFFTCYCYILCVVCFLNVDIINNTPNWSPALVRNPHLSNLLQEIVVRMVGLGYMDLYEIVGRYWIPTWWRVLNERHIPLRTSIFRAFNVAFSSGTLW